MDIEQIKKLIDLMVDNDLSELDISDGEAKVRLRRGPGGTPVVTAAPVAAAPPAPEAPQAASQAPPVDTDDGLIDIKSPMVGTFYASSGPDSEPFASVGETIAEDAVICIIEAMKVMNEIKSDCSGTVEEICVQDAHPVEFGQVLFRVRPA